MNAVNVLENNSPAIDIAVFPFCPNNCVFCTNRPTAIKEAKFRDIVRLIRKAATEGKKQLELSAMEPTLYPKLPLLITQAKGCGFETIHLVTNGLRINDWKYLTNLIKRGVNKITLSLHSHRGDLEAKITQNRFIFKKKIQAIKNITRLQNKDNKELSFYINTVINNYNYRYLPEIIKFIAELGIKNHNIYFPHIVGNAFINFDKIVPYYKDVKKYLEAAEIEAIKYGINLSFANIPHCIIKKTQRLSFMSHYKSASDGRDFIAVGFYKKIKRNQCRQCVYFNSCEGVYERYIKLRGWDEFVPLKKELEIKSDALNTAKKRYWVRLTKICNQDCLFCLDKEAQDDTTLSVKEIETDLKNGYNAGARRVILSGGEPTIHPRFVEIIKLAKKIGYEHVQAITNGLKLSDQKFFDSAVKAGLNEVTVSIHGHTSILHDKLVGVKGAFVKALKTLRNSKKYPNLIVSIDVCINKLNIRHLPEIIKTFINAGFYEFDLLHIIPFGSAWENRKLLFFDMEKELPHLHKALDFSKDKRVHIWTNRLPAQYLEGYEELIHDPVKIHDEINGRIELFNDFFRENKPLYCFGERCQYCFLQNFCQDLIKIKNGEELNSVKRPICLGKFEFQKEVHHLSLKEIFDGQIVDMKKFTEFYIKERYYVKSLRCKNCKEYNECDGAHIDLIKKNGFNILTHLNNP